MAGKRIGKAAMAVRITEVVRLLSMGLRPSEILQYISEKTTWGISERQVENYIQKANEEIKQSSKFDRDQEIGKSIQRLEYLYKSNLVIQDYKAALSTLKAKIEMLGLASPTKSLVKADLKAMTWRQFMESGGAGTFESPEGEGPDDNDDESDPGSE
jgi:inorganic triphosphatase YgiF